MPLILLNELFWYSLAPRPRPSKAKRDQSGLAIKAAMRGKEVCLAHGGRSTGPRTAAGRVECAKAKTVHGWETRALRAARAAKLRELKELERYMKGIGSAP